MTDIDVFQTVTSVSFQVEPNTNVININKVTVEAGGLQDLQSVTNVGATTTNGISIDTGDTGDIGLYAISSSTAVYGFSTDATAILGSSTNGTAIYGNSTDGIGVSAYSGSGIGLEVYGNGTVAIDCNLGNTNKGLVLDSGASSTGNPIEVIKNGVTKFIVNQEGSVTANQVKFNTTPTEPATATVGSLIWNDTAGTLDLKLKGGNTTLQIGQETVARIVNKTATNITLLEANYQVVRVTGAQGQRPKVDLALANNDLNSTTTLGLVTETILNNQEGFVTTSGQVQEINTTGSLQGETWLDGDMLYLSGTVAGRVTNIKPVAPTHTVIIGFVEYAHAVHGKIFVKVDNGYELDELHNVSAIAPNNNEVLTYDTPTLLWKAKPISTALGYTPVASNTAITAGTKTKITYDAKGLVTNGTDATTADIADSVNKRYVTDAQQTVITNTSGTNTGDNATNTQYSGLATSKANIDSPTFTGTVSGITKSMVGLGNVDNTSDLLKPISTATQTALNAKANIASPTFTGTVTTPAIVVSSETASTLASFDASKNIKSLSTTIYPSLTEIALVKGLTSRAQTQLDALKLEMIYLDSDDTYFDAFYIRTITDGATFEASNSLLSTMANLRSISYVSQGFTQQINADKFVQLGGTAEKYLMANGSALSNIATNTTTTALSLATLNSTYPTAIIGFRVHCISITAGKLIYERTSTGWVSYSITTVI